MKIGRKILIYTFAYLFGIASVFSAGPLDHFEVTLYPQNAKTGEALDLTIEAVDRSNAIVTDYTGMVLIFSESDPEAELPIVLEDNMYTFKASDQGKVIFENAIKFNVDGLQNIYVYDFDQDEVFGVAEVTITKSGDVASKKVDILSPENGLVIGDNKIKVSGTSDKNHQIKIIVNGSGETLTMTNDSGVYEKEITNLLEGTNTFVAKVLDADGKEVGTSNTISIKVEKNTISLISARAIPEELDSETAFEVEVIATPGLKEVTTVINDVISQLEETEGGKYLTKTYAPKDEGVYKIDVILKDDLGHEIRELGATSIKVNPILNAPEETKNEPEENDDNVETPITTTNEPTIIKEKNLKITGLKLVQLKSKSILTWDELKDAKSYNVYKKLEDGKLEFIENVKEPKFEVLIDMDAKEIKYDYFAVKALAETEDGEEYEGDLSEATKIQTGPEMIILLFIAMLLGGFFIMWRQKKA